MPFTAVVDAPKVKPALYDLMSVADVVDHAGNDGHWIDGVQWVPENGRHNAHFIDICNPGNQRQILVSNWAGLGRAPGFAIDVTEVCTSTFARDDAEHRRLMRDAVDRITSKACEMALWLGYGVDGDNSTAYVPSFTNLTEAEDLTPGSGAVKPVAGLAILEDALADGFGGMGVIHTDRQVGSHLALILNPGPDQLATKLGTPFVVGAGYDHRVGPMGTAAGEQEGWLFATGSIIVHLGPVEYYDVTDVRTNDVHLKAERPAVLVWDHNTLYAVRVTLS